MNRPKDRERHQQIHYLRPGQAFGARLAHFFGRKGKRSNGAAPADGGSAASAACSNQREEVEMAASGVAPQRVTLENHKSAAPPGTVSQTWLSPAARSAHFFERRALGL